MAVSNRLKDEEILQQSALQVQHLMELNDGGIFVAWNSYLAAMTGTQTARIAECRFCTCGRDPW